MIDSSKYIQSELNKSCLTYLNSITRDFIKKFLYLISNIKKMKIVGQMLVIQILFY